MTILIVDDSPLDRKLLKKDLIALGEYNEDILEASNRIEFINILKTAKPSIVFLDIHLGKDHAFKILQQIEHKSFEVIFTTSHSEYAVESFKYSPVDYLTKPMSRDRLKETLVKVKDIVWEKIKNQRNETLLYNISDFPKFEQRIALTNKFGLHQKRVNEIMYVHSDSPLCHFHFEDGSIITVTNSMKHYEDSLSQFNFYRTHDRYIVNLFFVESYISEDNTGTVILSDKKKTKIPVSRGRKDNLLKHLHKQSIR